jgi:hypothetical protein
MDNRACPEVHDKQTLIMGKHFFCFRVSYTILGSTLIISERRNRYTPKKNYTERVS